MTCYANNQGVERLLTDILMEVRKVSRELLPPTPPAPLPPPATKDFASGMPEKFLAISGGRIMQYIRVIPDSWEVLDVLRGQYCPREESDHKVKTIFDASEQVWVLHPK